MPSTCLDAYNAVNMHLRASLHALLSRFVPDPTTFLQMITPWGAMIVGEAALSHVLHDPTLCTTSLELAIGNLHFHSFLNSLSRLLPQGTLVVSSVVGWSPEGFPQNRHIARIAELRLASGLFVAVYESVTPSPCDVVARYWTTALMNFVTPFTLGCAYPRLTLDGFTLHCDTRSGYLAWWDLDMANRLDVYGFNSAARCDAWPLSAHSPTTQSPPSSASVNECGRSLYTCPHQGRYFGDPGSLIVFYDGFGVDLKELRDFCVAPYGPMVAWRLASSGRCLGSCLEKDTVLPPYVVSMLSQFAEDTSGSARSQRQRQQLVHTGSDVRNRSPVVSSPAPRQGRRNSV